MPAHQSFRHEALLYRDHGEYLDTVVPFLREGVERGEHVVVAVVEPTRHDIRRRLRDAADDVDFVDILELAANPARVMSALTALVADNQRDGRAVRVLGQPVLPGRRPAQTVESRLQEGLVNLAIPPDAPLWLLCPYDLSGGGPEIADHAGHSHPVILEGGGYRGSTSYAGAWYVENLFRHPLPPAPADAEVRTFGRSEIGDVANRVLATAFRAGLPVEASHRLSAAMRELASDAAAVATATLRLWADEVAVIGQIEDPVPASPLVGRLPATTRATRKGLWLANQTADLVQVRSTDRGTTVRVHTWR